MTETRRSEINSVAVEQLAIAMLKAVRSHYLHGPPARIKVFEVLHALATTTACVLHEADPQATRDWFDGALDSELADLALKKQGRPHK